jgi:hypothetical protein
LGHVSNHVFQGSGCIDYMTVLVAPSDVLVQDSLAFDFWTWNLLLSLMGHVRWQVENHDQVGSRD